MTSNALKAPAHSHSESKREIWGCFRQASPHCRRLREDRNRYVRKYVLNLSRSLQTPGFRLYIGRPSKWGNPFVIDKNGDRETVIAKYRKYILSQPSLMAALPELKGKVLGC